MNKIITHREIPCIGEKLCEDSVLERIYLARGVKSTTELEKNLTGLLDFTTLKNINEAIARLYGALSNQEKIIIIGDFDADGATSTAIAVRALRSFGAKNVSYIVPNRFEFGYGLTPEIVELAAKENPQLLLTVDNGIVSFAGVNKANEIGIDVIVTDHHLAADKLPNAVAIVNPNQPGDNFKSKSLAGCGVVFYVMLALRAYLREQAWFTTRGIDEPNMAGLLDIVAVGTVADLVPLDKNNRILVQQGLNRIRAGQCVPGIKALLEIGSRNIDDISAQDLAFAVAPRLNAAGRMDDMSLGIECLLSNSFADALKLGVQLERLNKERRLVEDNMKQQAFAELGRIKLQSDMMPKALCLYDENWHQGVIGILAARVKDKIHRPVVAFADGETGFVKGSARSIKGLHIRDVLATLDAKNPGLLEKFGGHAMAAGLTLKKENLDMFKEIFTTLVEKSLSMADLQHNVLCDGELSVDYINLKFANVLRNAGPWGQNFPEPTFANKFKLIDQRLVGEKHLKLTLALDDKIIDGILFNADLNLWPNYRCQQVMVAYRLSVNTFNNAKKVQLVIEHLEALIV